MLFLKVFLIFILNMINNTYFPKLKTGDMILLSNQDWFSKILSFVSGSKWNHCGILFVADEVYILECDVGQRKRSGVRVITLKQKLARYKGPVAVARLKWKVENKKALKFLKSKLFYNISNPIFDFLFGSFENVTYCSRLACDFYFYNGIPIECNLSCTPKDLLNSKGFGSVLLIDKSNNITTKPN